MALPLVPLALAGGIAGAEALASLIPTAADRRNKKKLKELLELEKNRQLGLTGQEQRVAEARTEMPLAQQVSAQMAAQNRALAAGGAGVGAALAAGQQMADTGALARQQAISDIEALDLQKKQAQLQEIEQRIAEKSRRGLEKRQAVLGALGDVAQTGLALRSQEITTQGPGVETGKVGAGNIGTGSSLNTDQLEFLKLLQENPDLFNAIMKQGA